MDILLNSLYITSVFPNLSETFIHREMQALGALGWKVFVFRIRGAETGRKYDAFSSVPALLPVMIYPYYWFRGLIWGFQKKRNTLKYLVIEIINIKSNILLKIKLVFLLLVALGMAEYIDANCIPITHIRSHFLHSETMVAYWLSKLLHLPHSITVHTKMIYYPLSLIRKAVQNASFCVGVSEETVELAKRLQNNRGANVFLIRNGIDFTILRGCTEQPTTGDTPLILAVGRLIPKKGFDTLVKACALLTLNGIRYKCKIVGGGPEFRSLKKLISEHTLDANVDLVGALPFGDIIPLFQGASVLVMPSRVCKDDVDGIPTVLIEAMALGVPVIASSIAGIPDLVKDGITGLLISPDDEFDLARKIKQILFDKSLCLYLGSTGKKEILDNFDIAKTSKTLSNYMAESLFG